MYESILAEGNLQNTLVMTAIFVVIILVGLAALAVRCMKKVEQGTALVRNGVGGTVVKFTWLFDIPLIHRTELMDISVKRIEIDRRGSDGLICQDNIRADIKVAFFVRVNKTPEDVQKVAQFLGCRRASEEKALIALFEPKFSEALKTVGKKFDFVELYTAREKFREEIIKIIGTDLNGYVLDDVAIDGLEQTPLEFLIADNVLDAEGIKKITDLTAQEQIRTNFIRREREKTVEKQDVEAREAILALQRQQAEAEEKQAREIAEIKARQRAEAQVVENQERQRAELARIAADEEISVADENRLRTIIVAAKNKERTDAVETERVTKDRDLEVTERERIVTLAQIEKDKAVEVEKKHIQDVIRERVIVERAVVEEEERIKDTQEYATADRKKRVAITEAEERAQQALVQEIKAAEAEKQAANFQAETIIIRAEAQKTAAEREMEAKKMLADAVRVESAATGLAEAEVLQRKLEAEATGKQALAQAIEKEGQAEAHVAELKFAAEAKGITDKAEAMKLFDGVGREHEEFKLRLNKDKEVELEAINIQKAIAEAQARMLGEALRTAKIDIVGGDNQFFDSLVRSITAGKQVDRLVEGSQVLSDVKDSLFTGDFSQIKGRLQEYVDMVGISSADLKNLSIATLILQLMQGADESGRSQLQRLLDGVRQLGLADQKASSLRLTGAKPHAKP
ncbi:MAG: flotillin family protein [Pirellulaceae bacterium]|nr:flotillin family protein [Pirellulaceae bacterium]